MTTNNDNPFSGTFDAATFENVDKDGMGEFIREDMMQDVHDYDAFGVRGENVLFVLLNGAARIIPHPQHKTLRVVQVMYARGNYAGRNLQTWFNASSLAELGNRLRADITRRIA